jgi:hypothetical protein
VLKLQSARVISVMRMNLPSVRPEVSKDSSELFGYCAVVVRYLTTNGRSVWGDVLKLQSVRTMCDSIGAPV